MEQIISWTAETCQYRPLLDMPKPDETKLAQIVRFLEDRCAYKEGYPALKTCQVSDTIKQQIADCEANYPKAEAD